MPTRFAWPAVFVALCSAVFLPLDRVEAAGGHSGGNGGPSLGSGSGASGQHSSGNPSGNGSSLGPNSGSGASNSSRSVFPKNGDAHNANSLLNSPQNSNGKSYQAFKSTNGLHNLNNNWKPGGQKFLSSQQAWHSSQVAMKKWNGNPWNWSHGGFWWGYYPFWWPVWGWGASYGYVYDYGDPGEEPAAYSSLDESNTVEVPTAAQVSAEEGSDESAGSEYFAQAQGAFGEGHYKDALRMANHAAIEMPQNPKSHELMSLSLFALGDYRGAAMEAHAALALGPAADWATLFNYYGDEPKYTTQLRALEKYSKDKPDAADAHFLRAYHYLMMGHREGFKDQMALAAKLAPKDKLSGDLLSRYGGSGAAGGTSTDEPPSVRKDPRKGAVAPKSAGGDIDE